MASTIPRRVALYLGGVQFFFALTWVVYVIYLPQLAAQAGVPKSAVIYLLMLDQLIFVAVDFAMGVAADRAARTVRRLAPAILAVTLLSCGAFVLLPFVAPQGSVGLFTAVTVVWAIGSSALRAPPLTLVGRHAAKPAQPALVAWSMLGLGVAAALAPYLGVALRGIDPHVPFVLSSLALALATLGIVAAERALLRKPLARATETAAAMVASVGRAVPMGGFVLAALLVALAFQAHVFLNSTPLYLRHATADQLQYLAPVFWVGFNLAMWPASALVKRFGGLRLMALSGAVAAVAALWAQQAGSLALLTTLQGVAGAAWGGVLVSAFSSALALGHAGGVDHTGRTGHAGRWSGALSSVLALAALGRMGVMAAGWPQTPAAPAVLPWLPSGGWLLAALLLVALGAVWHGQAKRASA